MKGVKRFKEEGSPIVSSKKKRPRLIEPSSSSKVTPSQHYKQVRSALTKEYYRGASQKQKQDEVKSESSDESLWNPIPREDKDEDPAPENFEVCRVLFGQNRRPSELDLMLEDVKLKVEQWNEQLVEDAVSDQQYAQMEAEYCQLEGKLRKDKKKPKLLDLSQSLEEESEASGDYEYKIKFVDCSPEEKIFESQVPVDFDVHSANHFTSSRLHAIFQEMKEERKKDLERSALEAKDNSADDVLASLPRMTWQEKVQYVSDQPAPVIESDGKMMSPARSHTDRNDLADNRSSEANPVSPEKSKNTDLNKSQSSVDTNVSGIKSRSVDDAMPEILENELPTGIPPGVDVYSYSKLNTKSKPNVSSNMSMRLSSLSDTWHDLRDRCLQDANEELDQLSAFGKQIAHYNSALQDVTWKKKAQEWTAAGNFLTGRISNVKIPVNQKWQTVSNVTNEDTTGGSTTVNTSSVVSVTSLSNDDSDSDEESTESSAGDQTSVRFWKGGRSRSRKRKNLPSARCIDMWTDIVDDGLQNVHEIIGEGWIELAGSFMCFIGKRFYLPAAALNKIMLEGILHNPSSSIRMIILSILSHAFSFFRPGPDDPIASKSYLSAMNTTTYDKRSNREFDPNSPWTFLVSLMEAYPSQREDWTIRSALSWKEQIPTVNDGDSLDIIPVELPTIYNIDGTTMTLTFWIQVLETDLQLWTEHYILQDSISLLETDKRPLVAKVIFPDAEVRWTRRVKDVCMLYVTSLVKQTDFLFHQSLRKLVSMVAELFMLKDFALKHADGTEKVQMSRFLADLIFQHKDDIGPSERLKRELYMLAPCWLSFQVSFFLLTSITNFSPPTNPTLVDVVNMFVNVDCQDSDLDDNRLMDEDASDGPNLATSTPKKSRAVLPAVVTTPTSTAASKTKTKKINLNKRNQYGENALHIACKKGKLEEVRQILATPGVDVNVTDNNANTPLHEAIHKDHIEVVKELIKFVPYPSVKSFFSPSGSGNKKNHYVNLLAMDLNEESPFYYAIEYSKNPQLLELILEFLYTESKKQSKHFPSLQEVLDKHKALIDQVQDDAKLAVLEKYMQLVKQIERPKGKQPTKTIPSGILNSTFYQDMLKNTVERYISSQKLFTLYRILKISRKSAGSNSSRAEELRRYPCVKEYPVGKLVHRFGGTSHFNIKITRENRVLDVKQFENMLYWWNFMPGADNRSGLFLYLDLIFPEHSATKTPHKSAAVSRRLSRSSSSVSISQDF